MKFQNAAVGEILRPHFCARCCKIADGKRRMGGGLLVCKKEIMCKMRGNYVGKCDNRVADIFFSLIFLFAAIIIKIV